jgi:hypothetical protein
VFFSLLFLHPSARRFNFNLALKNRFFSPGMLTESRSTVFSWHFENNGWMSDWSLTILEVSVCVCIVAKHFILSLPTFLDFRLLTRSHTMLQIKTPTKLNCYMNTLELYNLFICNMISVIILFLYVWALSKEKNIVKVFLVTFSTKEKWKTKIYIDFLSPFHWNGFFPHESFNKKFS